MRSSHDLSDPTPWRRSLRASQARRAAAATRRRTQHPLPRRRHRRAAGPVRRRDRRAGRAGLQARRGGPVLGAGSRRRPRRPLGHRRRRHRRPADAPRGQALPAAHGLPVDGQCSARRRSPRSASAGPARCGRAEPGRAGRRAAAVSRRSSLLESIALCESGGDPTAVSAVGAVPRQVPVLTRDLEGPRRHGGPGRRARVRAGREGRAAPVRPGPVGVARLLQAGGRRLTRRAWRGPPPHHARRSGGLGVRRPWPSRVPVRPARAPRRPPGAAAGARA